MSARILYGLPFPLPPRLMSSEVVAIVAVAVAELEFDEVADEFDEVADELEEMPLTALTRLRKLLSLSIVE